MRLVKFGLRCGEMEGSMKSLRKAFTGEEDTESDYVRQVRYGNYRLRVPVCSLDSTVEARPAGQDPSESLTTLDLYCRPLTGSHV